MIHNIGKVQEQSLGMIISKFLLDMVDYLRVNLCDLQHVKKTKQKVSQVVDNANNTENKENSDNMTLKI